MRRLNSRQSWILCVFAAAGIFASCARDIQGTYRRDTVVTKAGYGANEDIRQRVQAALHGDPYFYDAHVEVSVAKGHIMLDGFVFDDRDLGDAVRIARVASDGMPVINNLSIKVMGGWR